MIKGCSSCALRVLFMWDYCCRCCGTPPIKRPCKLSVNTKLNNTRVVLQNLLTCTVCFYSLYYIAVSLCIGILKVDEVDSLLAPFNYKIQPSWNSPKYLVSVISTEVTYIIGGLVLAWIVEECVWDYAITITLLHIGLTAAVMADFPSTEHWWIALGAGLVMMIFSGQFLAYHLFRNNFVHPEDLQNF